MSLLAPLPPPSPLSDFLNGISCEKASVKIEINEEGRVELVARREVLRVFSLPQNQEKCELSIYVTQTVNETKEEHQLGDIVFRFPYIIKRTYH